MTLNDLQAIYVTLLDFSDFVSANSNGEESGISEELDVQYSQAMEIIKQERYKLYLRNAKQKTRRKLVTK